MERLKVTSLKKVQEYFDNFELVGQYKLFSINKKISVNKLNVDNIIELEPGVVLVAKMLVKQTRVDGKEMLALHARDMSKLGLEFFKEPENEEGIDVLVKENGIYVPYSVSGESSESEDLAVENEIYEDNVVELTDPAAEVIEPSTEVLPETKETIDFVDEASTESGKDKLRKAMEEIVSDLSEQNKDTKDVMQEPSMPENTGTATNATVVKPIEPVKPAVEKELGKNKNLESFNNEKKLRKSRLGLSPEEIDILLKEGHSPKDIMESADGIIVLSKAMQHYSERVMPYKRIVVVKL